ncbi:GNAT family N-acetyltransferase [Vallitalea guaymasensis]|uniref:GNAT family N-acetyltransferase n=1 Tax=Vallitalea guaymasensis TaxID=1185412 RepID=UPI002352D075|nr:GNAT family N-acetyltransferase [Vallitalea guaymasensis]
MIFEKINSNHIEEMADITLGEYEEECSKVLELPNKDYKDLFCGMLSDMVTNNLGVVALDKHKVVGFMTGYGPISDFFGNVKGTFCPIHGHGAIEENRAYIYSMLYQEVAKIWVEQEIFNHAIAIYAHNEIAIKTFFQNGFGMRCVDAITSINNDKIIYKSIPNVKIEEIGINKIDLLIDLKNELALHMNKSPIFHPAQISDIKKFKEQSVSRKSRFFTANIQDKIIGYLEIKPSGETFVDDDTETMHICGAYIYPEYRGTGIYNNLIAFMIEKLKKEKFKRCGVDFESINPNANKFWLKYFTPYTYSLVRRIDERSNLNSIG